MSLSNHCVCVFVCWKLIPTPAKLSLLIVADKTLIRSHTQTSYTHTHRYNTWMKSLCESAYAAHSLKSHMAKYLHSSNIPVKVWLQCCVVAKSRQTRSHQMQGLADTGRDTGNAPTGKEKHYDVSNLQGETLIIVFLNTSVIHLHYFKKTSFQFTQVFFKSFLWF